MRTIQKRPDCRFRGCVLPEGHPSQDTPTRHWTRRDADRHGEPYTKAQRVHIARRLAEDRASGL